MKISKFASAKLRQIAKKFRSSEADLVCGWNVVFVSINLSKDFCRYPKSEKISVTNALISVTNFLRSVTNSKMSQAFL